MRQRPRLDVPDLKLVALDALVLRLGLPPVIEGGPPYPVPLEDALRDALGTEFPGLSFVSMQRVGWSSVNVLVCLGASYAMARVMLQVDPRSVDSVRCDDLLYDAVLEEVAKLRPAPLPTAASADQEARREELASAVRAAVLAEREACARIALGAWGWAVPSGRCGRERRATFAFAGETIARQIREREAP